ncbi:hypothetical protein HanRHA438_Chr09g0376351 [Helianthus annuus]|nr:hypothetical protein HanRHA438_Chr09g0376351 [Helianthus annuus]
MPKPCHLYLKSCLKRTKTRTRISYSPTCGFFMELCLNLFVRWIFQQASGITRIRLRMEILLTQSS